MNFNCTNFFEHQLKWNTGSRDSKNSTITNNWKSKFDGEENLFTDSYDFKKKVKISRITRIFSSSSHITSDWKSTIRGRRGKNFLAVYVTWNKKKLLVNSKKLTLKKDFSKEENVCQKKNCFLSKTKRQCCFFNRKNQRIFCQILQTYNKNYYVNKSKSYLQTILFIFWGLISYT